MRLLGAMLVLAVLGACADPKPAAPTPDAVRVQVNLGAIAIEAPIDAGWRRLSVVEDSAGHIVVFFRFDGSDSTAIGGAEVGDSADVTLHFTPGRYVVTCVRRHADGVRHSETGERLEFTVAAASQDLVVSADSSGPGASTLIRMHDFAFSGVERWPAGEQLIRVINDGQEDHQVRLARLMEGVTLRRWLTDTTDTPLDSAVAGMARIGRGESAYFEATLLRGRYVIYCLIPTADGEPHTARGMFREIVVE